MNEESHQEEINSQELHSEEVEQEGTNDTDGVDLPLSMDESPASEVVDTREFSWYVIRVISGQEKKIKGYIEAELGRDKLSHNVKQILIPMEKYIQLKDGKKVTKERNYYPGYILIEAHLTGEVIPTIKSVNGVVGFLGNKGTPDAMRTAEVNRILRKVDAINEEGGSIEIPFVVGDRVKVTDGPFNGMVGFIDDINEEKKKLSVIVKIFERSTPLELTFTQVEKEN